MDGIYGLNAWYKGEDYTPRIGIPLRKSTISIFRQGGYSEKLVEQYFKLSEGIHKEWNQEELINDLRGIPEDRLEKVVAQISELTVGVRNEDSKILMIKVLKRVLIGLPEEEIDSYVSQCRTLIDGINDDVSKARIIESLSRVRAENRAVFVQQARELIQGVNDDFGKTSIIESLSRIRADNRAVRAAAKPETSAAGAAGVLPFATTFEDNDPPMDTLDPPMDPPNIQSEVTGARAAAAAVGVEESKGKDNPQNTISFLQNNGITDINATDENENTPLHRAISNGQTEIVLALIDAGAKVNQANVDGDTPLHWAAENDHKETVQALIDFGAEVNARDEDGATPLHLAADNGHTEIVSLLENAQNTQSAAAAAGGVEESKGD